MQRREINKYNKQNFAPSLFIYEITLPYVPDFTGLPPRTQYIYYIA